MWTDYPAMYRALNVPPVSAYKSTLQKLSLAATAVLAFGIAVVTLTPTPDTGLPGSDKTYHILAFAALVLPLAFVGRWPVVPVFFGAIAYGGLIELLQPMTGRTAEWADFYADALGAALGVGVGFCLRWGLDEL